MYMVAVVDDEEPVRRATERVLRAAGYRVALFSGGAAFLDCLDCQRPACVLVDGKMPDMDGREVLSPLSGRAARVPAIVVSGHDSAEDRRAAAALGAVAFFSKPYDPEELLEAIAAAVAVTATD
jgi:two-component system C4-dicarboxylate transport response regulator DctD